MKQRSQNQFKYFIYNQATSVRSTIQQTKHFALAGFQLSVEKPNYSGQSQRKQVTQHY